MIEGILLRKGIEITAVSEDICSVPKDIAKQSVCIDFTTPDAFKANYKSIAENFKAAVIGTTGWDDVRSEVTAYFEQQGTAMIYSSNFSIGVNAVFAALEKAGAILKDHGYVPHIEETHHVKKLDAPSGTAKTMAEIVATNLGIKPDITSIREGDVPGTHVVKFKSDVDKIKISHEAFSREGFAEGAVVAAEMADKLTGVHSFKELII